MRLPGVKAGGDEWGRPHHQRGIQQVPGRCDQRLSVRSTHTHTHRLKEPQEEEKKRGCVHERGNSDRLTEVFCLLAVCAFPRLDDGGGFFVVLP